MANKQKRQGYSRRQIRLYWAEKNIWRRKGYATKEDFIRDKNTCFACMFSFSLKLYGEVLEKAHIKAVSTGGEDVLGNIHLLCAACHRESEMLEGPEYWKWFVTANYIDRFMGYAVSKDPDTIMLYHNYLSEGHTLQDIKTLIADVYRRYLVVRDDWFKIEKDSDPCAST